MNFGMDNADRLLWEVDFGTGESSTISYQNSPIVYSDDGYNALDQLLFSPSPPGTCLQLFGKIHEPVKHSVDHSFLYGILACDARSNSALCQEDIGFGLEDDALAFFAPESAFNLLAAHGEIQIQATKHFERCGTSFA